MKYVIIRGTGHCYTKTIFSCNTKTHFNYIYYYDFNGIWCKFTDNVRIKQKQQYKILDDKHIFRRIIDKQYIYDNEIIKIYNNFNDLLVDIPELMLM